MQGAIPLVSVVIPLYNKEKYIRRAIQSVFIQNVENLEIIVINDGSTDKGREVVEEINDQRIRLINQRNHGVSFSRNIAAG